jgi:hypothetical protein
MHLGLRIKYPFLLPDFNGTEYLRQIFEKYLNIKHYENPSNGSRVVPCGKTDIPDEAKSLGSNLRIRLKEAIEFFKRLSDS